MFFSWLYLRVRYHWTQLLGVAVCIAGLALVVVSDIVTNKGWDPIARGKGDAFMIAGATLYGFSASMSFVVACFRLIARLLCNSQCYGGIPGSQATLV